MAKIMMPARAKTKTETKTNAGVLMNWLKETVAVTANMMTRTKKGTKARTTMLMLMK